MRLNQDELKREYELQEERERELRAALTAQPWAQVEELEKIWRTDGGRK